MAVGLLVPGAQAPCLRHPGLPAGATIRIKIALVSTATQSRQTDPEAARVALHPARKVAAAPRLEPQASVGISLERGHPVRIYP